jgi:hypothetical protein
MKKKGDLASPIIMWLAILAVVIIVISWYVTSIRPLNAEASVIEYDLRQLFIYVDNACNSRFYEAKYNPRMNYGQIEFNQSSACIITDDLNSCIYLTCNFSAYSYFNLSDIINLIITKSDGVLNVTAEDYNI